MTYYLNPIISYERDRDPISSPGRLARSAPLQAGLFQSNSAHPPVNLVGPPITFANRFIGSPIIWNSPGRRSACRYKDKFEERAPERSGFCDSATDCDALDAMLTQLMPPPEAVLLCRSSSPASLGAPRPVDSTSVRQTFTCCALTQPGSRQ